MAHQGPGSLSVFLQKHGWLPDNLGPKVTAQVPFSTEHFATWLRHACLRDCLFVLVCCIGREEWNEWILVFGAYIYLYNRWNDIMHTVRHQNVLKVESTRDPNLWGNVEGFRRPKALQGRIQVKGASLPCTP